MSAEQNNEPREDDTEGTEPHRSSLYRFIIKSLTEDARFLERNAGKKVLYLNRDKKNRG